MLKRDFLLAQINKFAEVVFSTLFQIENNNIAEAEEIIQKNYSGALLDNFLSSGQLPEDKPEYETLLFQLELLYAKLRLNQAKGLPVTELKEKYLRIADLVLRQQKDFNLNLQSRIKEVEGMEGD